MAAVMAAMICTTIAIAAAIAAVAAIPGTPVRIVALPVLRWRGGRCDWEDRGRDRLFRGSAARANHTRSPGRRLMSWCRRRIF